MRENLFIYFNIVCSQSKSKSSLLSKEPIARKSFDSPKLKFAKLDNFQHRTKYSPTVLDLGNLLPENLSCAKSMKAVAMKKGVGKVFEVGEVVLVPLHNVDEAKVDAQNLTGVIFKIDIIRMLARVVVKTGLLKQYYSYHELTCVLGMGNNIKLLHCRRHILDGRQ